MSISAGMMQAKKRYWVHAAILALLLCSRVYAEVDISISSATPSSAYASATVTLRGSNFYPGICFATLRPSGSSLEAGSCKVEVAPDGASVEAVIVLPSVLSAGVTAIDLRFADGTDASSCCLLTILGRPSTERTPSAPLGPFYFSSTVSIAGRNFATDPRKCFASTVFNHSTIDQASSCRIESTTLVVVSMNATGSARMETEAVLDVVVNMSNPKSVGFSDRIALYPSPSIIRASRDFVYVDSTVTIIGTHFINSQSCTAHIGDFVAKSCRVVDQNSVEIVAMDVTANKSFVKITMSNPSSIVASSNEPLLTVSSKPIITRVVPSQAYQGASITAIGSNFKALIIAGSVDKCAARLGTDSVSAVECDCLLVENQTAVSVVAAVPQPGMLTLYIFTSQFLQLMAQYSMAVDILPAPSIVRQIVSLYRGSIVTITGSNLIPAGNPCGRFGNVNGSATAKCSFSSLTSLVVSVPANAVTGLNYFDFQVTNPEFFLRSSSTYKIFGSPRIFTCQPPKAYAGSIITVTGENFIPNGQNCRASISKGDRVVATVVGSVIPASTSLTFDCSNANVAAFGDFLEVSTTSSESHVHRTLTKNVTANSILVAFNLSEDVNTTQKISLRFPPGVLNVNTSCSMSPPGNVSFSYILESLASSRLECAVASESSLTFKVSQQSLFGLAFITVFFSNPDFMNTTSPSPIISISPKPVITSIHPNVSYARSTITAYGRDFVYVSGDTTCRAASGDKCVGFSRCTFESNSSFVFVIAQSAPLSTALSICLYDISSEPFLANLSQVLTVIPPPVIFPPASLAPAVRAAYRGSTVTLTGNNFIPSLACSVRFHTASLEQFSSFSSCSVLSSTALQVVVPNPFPMLEVALGVDVNFSNPAGFEVSSDVFDEQSVAIFRVMKDPRISIDQRLVGYAGSVITVAGANLIQGFMCSADIGYEDNSNNVPIFVPSNPCKIVNSNSFTLVVGSLDAPRNFSKIIRVNMTNPSWLSFDSSPSSFRFDLFSLPTIQSISPSVAYPGSTVQVLGSNFIAFPDNNTCVVIAVCSGTYNRVSLSCVIISVTAVRFVVDANAVEKKLCQIQIYMNNPSNASGISISSTTLSIIKLPTITGISPPQAYAGGTITLFGSDFMPLPLSCEAFILGSLAATCTINSTTSITVKIAGNSPMGSSTVSVTFSNPKGLQVSSSANISVVSLSVISADPVECYAGSTITIRGSNFIPGTCNASVGSAPFFEQSECKYVDGTSLRLVVNSAATPGKDYNVYIYNSDDFSVRAVRAVGTKILSISKFPIITSVSPRWVYNGSVVTITGENFIGASQHCAVFVCDFLSVDCVTQATSCAVISPSTITFVVANATTRGTYSRLSLKMRLKMLNPDTVEVNRSVSSLAVLDDPSILQLKPSAVYVGNTFTVEGQRFIADHPCNAFIGGVFAKCSFIDSGSDPKSAFALVAIPATMPAELNVNVNFTLNLMNPSRIQLSSYLNVSQAPSVSELRPAVAFSGTEAYSGSIISLVGSHFLPAPTGSFNKSCWVELSPPSVLSPSCTVMGSSLIQFVTPNTRSGVKLLTLKLAYGDIPLSQRLRVGPSFSVTSARPASAYASSVITISGSFIHPGYSCSVRFTDANGNVFESPKCEVVSESSIHAVVPSIQSFGNTGISLSLANPIEYRINYLPGMDIFGNASLQAVPPSPSHVYPGSVLTVTGSNFILEDQLCKAYLGNLSASKCWFASATSAVIVLSAANQQVEGNFSLFIETSNPVIRMSQTEVVVTVHPTCSIASVKPDVAHRGDVVNVTGANFISDATCLVLLGTTGLYCKIWSDSSLSFVVPPQAELGRFNISFTIAGLNTSNLAFTVAGTLGAQLPLVRIDHAGAASSSNTLTVAVIPESGLSYGRILLTLAGFGEMNADYSKRMLSRSVSISSNQSSCVGRASFLSAEGRPLEISFENCSVPKLYPVTIVVRGINNPKSMQPVLPVSAAIVQSRNSVNVTLDKSDSGTLAAILNNFSVVVTTDSKPRRPANVTVTLSGITPGINRIVVTLTGTGWTAANQSFVGGFAEIVASVLTINMSPPSGSSSAMVTLTAVVHANAPQPASTSVPGATFNGSAVVDLCKSGSLTGLLSDLPTPAESVVKFQISVSVVPRDDSDRVDFVHVLATELGCSPHIIIIDWKAADAAVVIRAEANRQILRSSSPVTIRTPVTLQVEIRWDAYSDTAVPPSVLVSRLEAQLSNASSPLRAQLGIQGVSRPLEIKVAAPLEESKKTSDLSEGAVAGIVIAVLIVVFAVLAWFFRQSLVDFYRTWTRTRTMPSSAIAKSPTSSSAHLNNDVSIISNSSDISLSHSPGPASFVSSRAPASIHDSSSRMSPDVSSTNLPPQRRPPPLPAAHYEDTNRYSMVLAGAHGAELTKDLDVVELTENSDVVLQLDADAADDDVVDISNLEEEDVVSIDMGCDDNIRAEQ